MASVTARVSGVYTSRVKDSHRRFFPLHKSNQSLPSNFNRLKNTARLQIKQRLFTALASNSNPGGKTSFDDDAAKPQPQGPPLLTILAGVLVFIFVFWIVGSLLMSIITFISKLF